MKQLLTILCLTVFTFGYSQDKQQVDFKKNEIKGNALYLVTGTLEATYERLLSEESGAGVSLSVAYDSSVNTKYSLTPFYRYYFGKKPAAGFFAEGFGMLNCYDSGNIDSNGIITGEPNNIDFALGFGIGSKWVTKKGFLFEINSGVGRNLFNSNGTDYEIVGRGGITLGYRF